MTARTPIPAAPQDPDGTRYRDDRSGTQWGWLAALAILIVGVIIIAALLLFDPNGDVDDEVVLPGVDAATINEIMEQTDEFIGERVAVTGRVEELLTERVLLIGGDLAQEDLLVLIDPAAAVGGYGLGVGTAAAPLPLGETYQVGDVVQFAGEVREFDREQMAEEFGLVLNEELFTGFGDSPALVVDRLDVATVGNLGIVATAPPEGEVEDGGETPAPAEESPAPQETPADAPAEQPTEAPEESPAQ